MSATHIGIASPASMPESFAMLSHFDEWVLRRSMTRSKSNMVASGVAGEGRSGQLRPAALPFLGCHINVDRQT
jgi:hypothetical protein